MPQPPSHASSSAGVVRVTFVDHANGATLGEVELHASRLPASFAPATVLHLGDDDWEVVSAAPSDSVEYLRTGALTLTLRHAAGAVQPDQSLAPRATVLAYPTLADPLPASSTPRPVDGAPLLEVREDEWRQIEFVGDELEARVREEFDAIARVANEARAAGGYKRAHARRAFAEPLAGVTVTPEALRAAFRRVAREYAGVAFEGREHAIDGGFAFRTAGELTVYGTAREGRVESIALRPERDRRGPPVDAAALAQLRRAHGLVLVDWCARVAVRPGTKPGDVS